jgi:hypothetical protein
VSGFRPRIRPQFSSPEPVFEIKKCGKESTQFSNAKCLEISHLCMLWPGQQTMDSGLALVKSDWEESYEGVAYIVNVA